MRTGWVLGTGGSYARYTEAEGFHLYVPVCQTVSEVTCSEQIIC